MLDVMTTNVLAVCMLLAMGVPVILSGFRRGLSRVDLALLLAVAAGLAGAVSGYVYGATDLLLWSGLNGACYTAAMGCVWLASAHLSMYRVRWRGAIAVATTIVVIIAPYLDHSGVPEYWRGGLVYFASVVVISWLSASDLFSGGARDLAEARALAWLLLAHGGFFFLRLVVFAGLGPDSPMFRTWLDSGVATVFELLLYISGGNLLLALRNDISLRESARKLELDPFANVLPVSLFRSRAGSFLHQLSGARRRATMVTMRVEGLEDIALIHGKIAADAVAKQAVSVAGSELPSHSLATRLGSSRFAWLLPDAPRSEVVLAARRVSVRLRELDVPGLRDVYGVSVAFGLADTAVSGYGVGVLLSASTADLVSARVDDQPGDSAMEAGGLGEPLV